MDDKKTRDLIFQAGWNNELLHNMESNYRKEDGPALIRKCADYHYRFNDMDKVLTPFIGDLNKFIGFLTNEWGWVVKYNEQENVIIADENKNYCVCPISNNADGQRVSPILCHCSEGFAQKMFGKVIGKDVKAEVISSVLRGDKSCIYKISF